jgi:hypothetical protein
VPDDGSPLARSTLRRAAPLTTDERVITLVISPVASIGSTSHPIRPTTCISLVTGSATGSDDEIDGENWK